MTLIAAFIVALTSLVLAPGYLFYFDVTPKVVVLLFGTAITLCAAAASGVSIPWKSRRMVVFSLLLLLYVLSLAVATAVSTNPVLSLFGSSWRRFGSVIEATACLFAWLIAVGCAGRPGRVITILRGVTAAGSITAAYGIAQYFGWDPLPSAARYHFGAGIGATVRPPATLGHGNYLATWLLFVVFLSLALARMETSRIVRRLSVASALLASFAMLLTGTRSAIAGMIAGGLVWIAIQGFPHLRRVALAAALAILAGITLYFTPPGRPLRARAQRFVEDPWGGDRLALWNDSVRMARVRLAAGYGPEVFAAEFPHFESLQVARGNNVSANNMFVDAFVAQGLTGMLLLAALCAGGFLAAIRLKQPAFAAALAAGIVSQQFLSLTVSNAMILWVTLGLLAALDAPSAEPRRRMLLIPGAAVVAALLLYVAVRLASADHALALAKQRIEVGDPARAEQEYTRYESIRLPGAGADVWYSQALLAEAEHFPNHLQTQVARVARAAAVRGTENAEDPSDAWYNLAVFCEIDNDRSCVEHSLRQAIAANPMRFKPHWALAQILPLDGRMEEARRETLRATELAAGMDPETKRALSQMHFEIPH